MESKEARVSEPTVRDKNTEAILHAQVAWLSEFKAFVDDQKGVELKPIYSEMTGNGPLTKIRLELANVPQQEVTSAPSASSSTSSSSSGTMLCIQSMAQSAQNQASSIVKPVSDEVRLNLGSLPNLSYVAKSPSCTDAFRLEHSQTPIVIPVKGTRIVLLPARHRVLKDKNPTLMSASVPTKHHKPVVSGNSDKAKILKYLYDQGDDVQIQPSNSETTEVITIGDWVDAISYVPEIFSTASSLSKNSCCIQ